MRREKIETKKKSEIWAVAGGKGGTGKSFVTSVMGNYLANEGKKVILIDIDIGGANLHSILGIDEPKKSLTNFFDNRTPLHELPVRTGIDNLRLITGDIYSLNSDMIKHSQKLKLFRHISSLNTGYVLIDLGRGSHYNTLDTFLMADKMITVLTPEIMSVENLYHFIKNALFRKLKTTLKAYGFREFLEHVWQRRESYKIKNLWELIDWFKSSFSFIGDILDEELADFKIYLILNKVRNNQDIHMGSMVKSAFMKYLGIKSQYVGYIEYDDSIWKSTRKRQPFLQTYSSTSSALEIESFVENLLQEKEIMLPLI